MSSLCVISDETIFSIGETNYLKMKTKIKKIHWARNGHHSFKLCQAYFILKWEP